MSVFLKTLLLGSVFLVTGCSQGQEDTPVSTTLSPDEKHQHVRILVNHAYTPSVIIAKPNIPIELNFKRQESTDSCAKDLLIPSENIQKKLPNQAVTTVVLPASKPGVILFQCSMNMMRGKIIIQ
jgi:plastocyanin domain-containing protein